MARLFLTASVLFAAIAAAGPSAAEIVWTSAPSVMRRAPNPVSRFVQEVPANAQVDLRRCAYDWCRASWRGRVGYIPAYAVGGGPAPIAAPPQVVYSTPPVVYAPPPVVYAPPPVFVAPPPPPGPVWGGSYVGFGFGGW